MKKTIVIVVAAFGSIGCPAQNQSLSKAMAACYEMANFIEVLAKTRDAGMSEAEAGQVIVEKAKDKPSLLDYLPLLHAIYLPPVNSKKPSELSGGYLQKCLNGIGTDAEQK